MAMALLTMALLTMALPRIVARQCHRPIGIWPKYSQPQLSQTTAISRHLAIPRHPAIPQQDETGSSAAFTVATAFAAIAFTVAIAFAAIAFTVATAFSAIASTNCPFDAISAATYTFSSTVASTVASTLAAASAGSAGVFERQRAVCIF
jgi:hypothetical protein